MRYYDLTLSDPDTGEVWKPTANGDAFEKSAGGTTFTSYVNGQTNPNALNVEIDVPAVTFNQPQGAATIVVWGIGLPMIGQSTDLNPDPVQNKFGAVVKLRAGMQKGLPLAKPQQAGLILEGNVFQAFGNWQGVNQSLNLICYPPATQDDQNIMWDWPAGTTLASALLKTFQQAFGKYDMVIDAANITIANITQTGDEKGGGYTRLSQLADHVLQRSQELGAPLYDKPDAPYSGVQITIIGNKIFAWDSQNLLAPIPLDFTDLIGQPTWIGPSTVSFKAVMRSDIAVGSQVQFPKKGLATPYVLTTPQASFPNTPARSKSAFQGLFTVIEVHHFGNFRDPNADSWVTAYKAVASPVMPT